MSLHEEGISICFNDKQFLKAKSPINLQEDGISMHVKDEQFWNA